VWDEACPRGQGLLGKDEGMSPRRASPTWVEAPPRAIGNRERLEHQTRRPPVFLRHGATLRYCCCVRPVLALSNHPRGWTAWGGGCGRGHGRGILIQDGSDFARRANAAHGARSGDRKLAR